MYLSRDMCEKVSYLKADPLLLGLFRQRKPRNYEFNLNLIFLIYFKFNLKYKTLKLYILKGLISLTCSQ
jgi:hypothetical protein